MVMGAVPSAGVAGGDGTVFYFQNTIKPTRVGRVVRGHDNREGVTLVEKKFLDDIATRLIQGRKRFVEQEDFGALHGGPSQQAALELAP